MQTYINFEKNYVWIFTYMKPPSSLHFSKNSTMKKKPPLTADVAYERPLIYIISRLRIKLMPFAWQLNFLFRLFKLQLHFKKILFFAHFCVTV